MSDSPSVGRPLLRPEDRSFLQGQALYGADLALPGWERRAYVAFVRSPFAHADVLRVDVASAIDQPGVLGAFSAAEVDLVPVGPFSPALSIQWTQPLLAASRVRYVGEPVAVVVATSLAAAVDAAEHVVVAYEPRTPVLDLTDALAGETLVFDGSAPTEVRGPTGSVGGGVDGGAEGSVAGNVAIDTGWKGTPGLADADLSQYEVVVSGRIMNPRQAPAPIEGRVMTAEWTEHDTLVVWSANQRPHGFRNELAVLYDIAPERVTVTAGPNVGGGFGGKTGRGPEERLLPWLARAVDRPVTWAETRTENLTVGPQGRGELIHFELAGTSDGRIEALRSTLVKDGGAYPMTGALLPGGYTVPGASGCYDIEQVAMRAVSVATNRVPTSAYRGAGRAPYIAGLERMVDRYAAAIGLDPSEVRRRNLVRPEQHPLVTPTGGRYDEADYPADLATALATAGYDELRVEQARLRSTGAVEQLGIGLACYNHMTVGGGGEEASMTLLADASARVITGSTDQGHGHAVTWAQIAADVTGIDWRQIEVVEGSTALIATGVGAVGSRSAQTAGMAVHRSGTKLVEEAKLAAASLLEASPDDMAFTIEGGGRFHVTGTPARSVGWAEIAAARTDDGADELCCGDVYDVEGGNSFPSGTHIAIVLVDTETGAVQLNRFVAVDDAGVRVNPMIVDGQLHGGIAGGIGQALGEIMVDDDQGNLLTTTFMNYAMATADQLPSFELVAGGVATSFNPLGIKGVGESGIIGATPAVHNAVIDALAHLGVDDFDLPCTPERVWAAIVEAGRGRQS